MQRRRGVTWVSRVKVHRFGGVQTHNDRTQNSETHNGRCHKHRFWIHELSSPRRGIQILAIETQRQKLIWWQGAVQMGCIWHARSLGYTHNRIQAEVITEFSTIERRRSIHVNLEQWWRLMAKSGESMGEGVFYGGQSGLW